MNEQQLEQTLIEINNVLKSMQESKKNVMDKWIRPIIIALLIALFGAVGNTVKNIIALENRVDNIQAEINQMKKDINFNFSILEKKIDNDIKMIHLEKSNN